MKSRRGISCLACWLRALISCTMPQSRGNVIITDEMPILGFCSKSLKCLHTHSQRDMYAFNMYTFNSIKAASFFYSPNNLSDLLFFKSLRLIKCFVSLFGDWIDSDCCVSCAGELPPCLGFSDSPAMIGNQPSCRDWPFSDEPELLIIASSWSSFLFRKHVKKDWCAVTADRNHQEIPWHHDTLTLPCHCGW